MDLPAGTVLGVPDSGEWQVVLPADTQALLDQLRLPEQLSVRPWEDGLVGEDTVVVEYVAYACTCPDHEVLDTSVTGGIKAFYVEPVSENIRMPWRAYVSGNRFELIGRWTADLYTPSADEHPLMPGHLFTYRSIRLLHPYRLWGPSARFDEPELNAVDSPMYWGPGMKVRVPW